MAFGPLSQAISIAIQQNYLQREFQDALESVLAYRLCAERMVFPGRVGTTITETRVGLMIPNTTPLNPATNTNLDNGTIPQNYTSEQFTLGINQYPQRAPDLNLIDDETTIKAFMLKNAYNLGYAASQTTERLARNALFNSYMSYNTRIRGSYAPGTHTTLIVDDIRGFNTVIVNGVPTPVSVTAPLNVTINGVANQVTGSVAITPNLSSAAVTGAIYGSIDIVTPITPTVGWTVLGNNAPLILRPNARANTAQLISSDTLDMPTLFSAVGYLRSNGVPTRNGRYDIFVSPTSMIQLYNDPQFQLLTRGRGTQDTNYKNLRITEFLDMRFIETTEAFVQPVISPNDTSPVTVPVQRPIVCGADVLIEGHFEDGADAILEMARNDGFSDLVNGGVGGIVAGYKDIFMYMRRPLDVLGQIVSQTANWIGGYTVPTDVGTNSSIIPTASNAYYKRAVVIETAS